MIKRLNHIISPLAILFSLLLTLSVTSQAAASASIDSVASARALCKQPELLDGKVVYVDFWASWCPPCRESFSWLEAMHRRYSEAGLRIVAVNLDREAGKAKKFLHTQDVSFEVVYDYSAALARLYELEVMPSSFIYSRQGKLLARHQGFRASDTLKLQQIIQQALEEEAQ